jgi:hypothetical protein
MAAAAKVNRQSLALTVFYRFAANGVSYKSH